MIAEGSQVEAQGMGSCRGKVLRIAGFFHILDRHELAFDLQAFFLALFIHVGAALDEDILGARSTHS